MQEKQAAELVLQKEIEEERAKRQQEKQRCKEEHRKEEELRKQFEDAEKVWCNAKATAAADSAAAQLISPSKSSHNVEVEIKDSDLNKNLIQYMTGGGEEDVEGVNYSPPKNKLKKSTKVVEKPVPTAKHAVKSTLKAGFNDSHVHNFPRILVEASIELKGETPVQELIVCLQELLKNGQMVNKNFAFFPAKPDGGTKKIHDPSSV
jgi:hypothetical protein